MPSDLSAVSQGLKAEALAKEGRPKRKQPKRKSLPAKSAVHKKSHNKLLTKNIDVLQKISYNIV